MKTQLKRTNLVFLFLIICLPLIMWSVVPDCIADNVITIAEGPAPDTLDPHVDTTQAFMNISKSICEPLGYYYFSPPRFEPNLAESWKMLDKTKWELKLRKGIKFTNGEPFDANTVKFSIERIRNPKLKARAIFLVRDVKEVKILDSHTVHIITKVPNLALPFMLFRLGMVPPNYIKENGDVEFGKHPIGTGPFMLNKWVKDEYVELKANKDYWQGRPKLDRVIFKSIPETITRMAALKTGEADLISNVMIEEIPAIEKNKDLQIVKTPSTRTLWAQYNMMQDSPLKDKRVRQAMNYAVDVESIIKNVLQGYGRRLNAQVLCKEYDGFNPHVKPYAYDPEKARQLIKAAGCENYTFTLNAPTGRYLRDKEIAEVVGNQLNAAGIKTTVRITEFGTLMKQVFTKKFKDLALWGVATPPTAHVFLGAIIRQGPGPSTYINPEYDRIYDKAAASVDKAERQQLFYQLGEIGSEDPIALYLHQQLTIYAVNKRVGGFMASPDEWIYAYPLYVK